MLEKSNKPEIHYWLIPNKLFEIKLSRINCYDPWYDDYDFVLIDGEYVVAVITKENEFYDVEYMSFPEFSFSTTDEEELIKLVSYHDQKYREFL